MEHPWAKQHRLTYDPPEAWFELEEQLAMRGEKKAPEPEKPVKQSSVA
jgi:hypothetical protein